ncbi:MAG: 6-hydroxymethylpterin diphosphokinase MptE-like protein [Phycisphaerales bacterium]
MPHAIFEANLTALAKRNPRLVERLRSAAPADTVEFLETPQEAPTARYDGAYLASRHRPVDEATRFAESVDVIEHAVVAVYGFALGHHVRRLCERMAGTGVVVVYEPDIPLLRAVFEQIDHSAWMREAMLVIIDDAEDRPELSARLDGAAPLFAQGATMVEHPPSRRRLGAGSATFAQTFAEIVRASRTTLVTTLVHSVTTCRNLSLNLDRYGAGDGIAPLKDWARGHGAILVAAGPSLSRNIDLLDDPALRERVVIIAVQTALKPLLARGIRPHFVTALDYHEISRQFYDGLDADALEGVTLICEPKVNRSVIDAYPGPIRCTGNDFLDRVLGPDLKREMGRLKPGSTVAHLSFYLAQYFGCDPIVFVGQDLGFSDGLYYGPGAAIHEQWAPELNRFNTLDMMEWQRVARMKRTLRTAPAQHGGSVYLDEQMSTYLQQFERDFKEAPQRIIDATEGGTAKKHTEVVSLARAIDSMSADPLTPLPSATVDPDSRRLTAVRDRLQEIQRGVKRLRELSQSADRLIDRMLEDQADAVKMDRHFSKMDSYRAEVDELFHIFDLVNALNQLGAFNRMKADRRLELSEGLDTQTRQRRQLERDQVNVRWLADACDEYHRILEESQAVLGGESVDPRISRRTAESVASHLNAEPRSKRRVAALVAVDPERSGAGLIRRLDDLVDERRTVLQATLERLAETPGIESIVLLAPLGFDVDSLIDRDALALPTIVERVPESLYGSAQQVIAAARRWSGPCWRGGIGGMTIFDEIVAPVEMLAVMDRLDLDAALVVGADWPLVDPSIETGCGALVQRYHEHPDGHEFVFSQAPPGLAGCVVSRSCMANLATRARPSTLGALLQYVPQAPQTDPITKEMCVKLPAAIRSTQARLTWDSPESHDLIRRGIAFDGDPASMLASLRSSPPPPFPREIEIELTMDRAVRGPITPHTNEVTERRQLPTERVLRLLDEVARASTTTAVSFGGVGDPLLHPDFEIILNHAARVGLDTLHLETDLLVSAEVARSLAASALAAVTVRLNADTAETYRSTMGSDRFKEAVGNLEALINARAQRVGSLGALALPWIIPSMLRCRATLEELQGFFDRWVYFVGAAMISPPLPGDGIDDDLITVREPDSVARRFAATRLLVRADGAALVNCSDWLDGATVGSVGETALPELWSRVLEQRGFKSMTSRAPLDEAMVGAR